jgi:hypothetical protein
MKIHVLTIPDDPSQWGDWLGRQLCSLHLRQLIEELQVVAECSDSQAPHLMLKDVPDDRQLFELLQSGPASLEVDEIQQLFANPDTLGELQEFVLITGSDYWDQLSQESDAAERARAILVAKCSKWKSDFDQTLANLESGTMDFETARSQANATMMKLVTVLRSGPPA